MLKIDLHIHTIASGHAYNTILEYIQRAKELRMDIIGISDHGATMYGAQTNDFYFCGLRRVPQLIDGLRVLKGVEANIVGPDGHLDVTDHCIGKLDYVMAGFHSDADYADQGIVRNTEVMIDVIRSGKVDIITHPFVSKDLPIDIRAIAEAACERDVLLELNTSYLRSHRLTEESLERISAMLKVIRKHKKKVIVNSDSHSIWELGDDEPLEKLRHKIKLDDEMVINNYPDELLEMLDIEFKT